MLASKRNPFPYRFWSRHHPAKATLARLAAGELRRRIEDIEEARRLQRECTDYADG